MTEVRFSEPALSDLREIRHYSIDHFGGASADRYMRGLAGVMQMLSDHPLAGIDRSDIRRGTRSFPHRGHHIYYRIDDGGILIQRVLHYARQVRREMIDDR